MLASSASAQCCIIPPPRAPDMCGPGSYAPNPFGGVYGPNYYVRPPYPPFQGMILGPGGPGNGNGPGGFGTHPFARSPRDFFMIETDPLQSPYSYGLVSPANNGGLVGRP
jgi:hypothetical protein